MYESDNSSIATAHERERFVLILSARSSDDLEIHTVDSTTYSDELTGRVVSSRFRVTNSRLRVKRLTSIPRLWQCFMALRSIRPTFLPNGDLLAGHGTRVPRTRCILGRNSEVGRAIPRTMGSAKTLQRRCISVSRRPGKDEYDPQDAS